LGPPQKKTEIWAGICDMGITGEEVVGFGAMPEFQRRG